MELVKREAGQDERQPAGKGVATDPQLGHLRQLAQVARNPALQSVVTQIETRHPSQGVGSDPVPITHGALPEPAVGVRPIRSAGGLVEGLDHGHVGLVTVRTVVLLDPFQPIDETGCTGGAESQIIGKIEIS